MPITEEQIIAYSQGTLLQEAFHNLSKEDREFFKSGITDEEWQEMFGPSPKGDKEDND